MNARPRLAVSSVNIGRLYLRTGRLAEAEGDLRRAFDEARAVQELGLEHDAAEALVELYERTGDFRRALAPQRAVDELRGAVFSRENLAKVASLESRHEAEKKQDEIELLQSEREIQQLEVRRQRLWLALVAVSLVLLGAVALALWHRYRLKARTNAELAVAYWRMADLASHDELTGLDNRRSAAERLEVEAARAVHSSRPFSLALIDIDDFKRINDERGHAGGDEVLRRIGTLLAASLRVQDLAARWGGEEFLLVLPETGRDGALPLAEKLRHAAAALRVQPIQAARSPSPSHAASPPTTARARSPTACAAPTTRSTKASAAARTASSRRAELVESETAPPPVDGSPRPTALALLELLERPRPVAVQQPRQRAVGEQPAAGLAARAVVGLVLGVDDALHRRAADRAGLAEAAVHRHPRAERRDLLGEAVADLGAQPLGPLAEHGARGAVQPRDLVGRQAAVSFTGESRARCRISSE